MAVKDKETLQTEKDAALASGQAGGIVAAEHREVVGDNIDSMWTYLEGYVPTDLVPARVVVTDGGAKYLSLRETSERAAPQLCGETTTDIPNSPVWSQDNSVGQALLVHEYTLTEDQLVSEIEIYVPEASANLPNRFYVIVTGPNPGDVPVSSTLPTIATGSPNWRVAQFGNVTYRTGTKLAIYQAVLNGGTTQDYEFSLVYAGQNLEIPAADGEWSRDSLNTQLFIFKVDADGNDISTELGNLVPGASIAMTNTASGIDGLFTYSVVSGSDEGAYYSFAVQVEILSGSFNLGNATRLNSTYPVNPSATYPVLPGYYATQPSFATVQAFRIENGVPTPTTDAFGMRLRSTPACFSNDWTEVGGGAAALSAGAQRFVQGVHYSDQEIQPTTAYVRVPITFPKVNPFRDPSQIIVDPGASGQFSFASTGQAQSELALTIRRDGGGAVQYCYVWLELSLDGGLSWLSFGDPRVVSVQNNQVVSPSLPFTIANIEPTDLYRFTFQVSDAGENIRLWSILAADIGPGGLDAPDVAPPQEPAGIRGATMNTQFYPSEV